MKLLVLLLFLLASICQAIETNPIVGDVSAEKGGTINLSLLSYPKSLFYYISFDNTSAIIDDLVFDPLCEYNYKSGELVPRLAESWEISKDKLTYTFKIRKDVYFADGMPASAEDVLYTFQALTNTNNLTGALQVAFNTYFKKAELIDKYTIKFTANMVDYNNLANLCAGTYILPKHFFSKGDFNKSFNSNIMGSGPYEISEVKKGHLIQLKLRDNYWGKYLPQNKGRYNFKIINYEVTADSAVRFELFKKGSLDFIIFNSAKTWETETSGKIFENNWVVKKRVKNKVPQGFGGLVFNLRKALFKDAKVRKAISHMYNREQFNKNLFYNNYDLLSSYFPNSIYAAPNTKPFEYNSTKARALLKEAGWFKTDSSGILVKDNQRLEFSMQYTSDETERFLTTFKEDLKTIGIKMDLELITWSTFMKNLENFNFDMSSMQWTGEMSPDPRPLWHSSNADVAGSINLPGYKNKEVDKLIDSLGNVFNLQKRLSIFHKLDEILVNDFPYILGWYIKNERIGFWNKFGFPKEIIPNFSLTDRMLEYWWYDAKKDKQLQKAMKENTKL